MMSNRRNITENEMHWPRYFPAIDRVARPVKQKCVPQTVNDVTTTREDFTGTNVVKFGLSVTHPSLTLSETLELNSLVTSNYHTNSEAYPCGQFLDRDCQHQRGGFFFWLFVFFTCGYTQP